MSRPVDVLAVLTTAASIADRIGYEDFEEKCEHARAVLADFIKSAKHASATLSHIYNTVPLKPDLEKFAHDDFQRLDRSIARVGGAA